MIARVLGGVADPGDSLLMPGLDILKKYPEPLHALVKRAAVAGKAITKLVARLSRHNPEPINLPPLNLFQPRPDKIYDLFIAVRSDHQYPLPAHCQSFPTSAQEQIEAASKTAWRFRHQPH